MYYRKKCDCCFVQPPNNRNHSICGVNINCITWRMVITKLNQNSQPILTKEVRDIIVLHVENQLHGCMRFGITCCSNMKQGKFLHAELFSYYVPCKASHYSFLLRYAVMDPLGVASQLTHCQHFGNIITLLREVDNYLLGILLQSCE